MPVGLIAALKGDSLRLLSSLIEYLSDGFTLNKGFWKRFLSESSQTARKQPITTVDGCYNSHLDGAGNVFRLYNNKMSEHGRMFMKKGHLPDCANCGLAPQEKVCMNPKGKGAKGCPTLTKKKLTGQANKEYQLPKVREFARKASIQEGECYAERNRRPYVMHATKPRIQEIGEFARKMGYTRLGLVFCVGLSKEAMIVNQLLKSQDFETVSVACKVGSVPKEEIGLKESEKVFIGEYESMCNPILQAAIVNDAKTDFNILLGLCVGHDSLFFKYAEAPTTVLAVKDRVTGHNPLAPIYLSGNYYSWLKKP
jgi:uncharacterized metal-binding protein